MKRTGSARSTGIILILIGIVCRIRGWFIAGASMTLMSFDAADSEEVTLKKLEAVSDSARGGLPWLEIGDFFLVGGLLFLFGPWLWRKVRGLPSMAHPASSPRSRHRRRR